MAAADNHYGGRLDADNYELSLHMAYREGVSIRQTAGDPSGQVKYVYSTVTVDGVNHSVTLLYTYFTCRGSAF